MCASVVEYKVEDWSSYSTDFSPLHILEDRPFDQRSRWLSEGNQSPQFLVLKLIQPAILHSIKFGKYERIHQCNIRRLKIYGGMSMDKLHLLYEGGLENSPHPETLALQHLIDGQPFPCAYVKIVPLQSWGSTFSYSIWYVQLFGEGDPSAVSIALASYNAYREREALRLCLKHLRQNNFTDAFEAVQKRSRVNLEHPLLTQLHRHLVAEGDFERAEQMLKQCIEEGYLDGYIDAQPLEAVWKEVKPVGVAGVWPSMRGAHQMTFDTASQHIYVHGGWDGSKDLSDLWTYSTVEGTWRCLCKDSSIVGGPSQRSCHRMCLDESTQTLYFLGRFTEVSAVDKNSSLSDFYCYYIDGALWKKLSSDTAADGGPPLLFNHQMCFNAATQSLYVFGGRVISLGHLSEGTYGGLYVYHVPQEEWVCLQPDLQPSKNYVHPLVPRSDHALLFSQNEGLLYVAGGDRSNQPLRDMLTYNIQSDETTVLADGKKKQIPECGVTVRICLDEKHKEILMMASFPKVPSCGSSSKTPVPDQLWIYHIHTDKWLPVHQGGVVPCPRFAHQLVYDAHHDAYYMFGGNSGDSSKGHQSTMRMDDLWTMKINRRDRDHILKNCQLLIRKQKFCELSIEEPSQAVHYLQTKLSCLVDKGNSIERDQFQQLTARLFSPPTLKPTAESVNLQRNEIYSQLCAMFPSSMTQPNQSIADMVNIVTQ